MRSLLLTRIRSTPSANGSNLLASTRNVSHSPLTNNGFNSTPPVAEVERLINTEYYHYEHLQTGKTNVGCDEYSVPSHIREHIDYITPGLKLLTPSHPRGGKIEKRIFGVTGPPNPNGRGKPLEPPLKKPLPQPLNSILDLPLGTLCSAAIIPECISALYNITPADKAAPGNELGIFESLGDMYAQEDLDLFFAALAPQIPNGTAPILKGIDGGTAPDPVELAGPESDLDFEISYPIIYPQNSVLFQTDDPVYEANYVFRGFLNNFLDALDGSYCTYTAFGITGNSEGLDPPYPNPAPGGYKGELQCGVYEPTKVISISYGGQEADLPPSYQQRQCNEFMKLGLQGVSIVVSSGDSGVGPRGPNTNNCLGPNGTIFSPDFPATCPFLTIAGGTFLPPGADVTKDEEVAVTRFPSGGGFSNVYPIPDYQKEAVEGYFRDSAPSYAFYESEGGGEEGNGFGEGDGIYNRLGRGYPDISAVGDNVLIFNRGSPTLIGGTSASAPVFAAILNRINEERIADGKGTVGFVNPTLVSLPELLCWSFVLSWALCVDCARAAGERQG